MSKIRNSAVLWTGGKDSSFSLHLARRSGYTIRELVTFVPKQGKFLAHPLHFMKYQAEALSLPHHEIVIEEPFKQSYANAMRYLKDRGIDVLVAGDIAEVCGFQNWLKGCIGSSGIELLTPLWHKDRKEILESFISSGFRAIFSCVKKPWFSSKWLGRKICKNLLNELSDLSAKTGLDICGEQGEYHTLTLDGPVFKQSIEIEDYSRKEKDSIMYLDIKKINLKKKLVPSLSTASTIG